jgi:3-deoxy-D-arabino-heptulosonate 7-phosphate (DAHP) synthase class II
VDTCSSKETQLSQEKACDGKTRLFLYIISSQQQFGWTEHSTGTLHSKLHLPKACDNVSGCIIHAAQHYVMRITCCEISFNLHLLQD